MKILLTGAAGFIGFHTARRLLDDGHELTGIDNLNDFYDVQLKRDRLQQLVKHPAFRFHEKDLIDHEFLDGLFGSGRFDRVIHLAAQAGVRDSIERPRIYVERNIQCQLNVLECCRHHRIPHLVYASSSSVYGLNAHFPFSVKDNVDHPMSMYGATKKAGELMAHSYSHLFQVPTTGLRFFSVYGPWGRPDMALFKFTRNILRGEPIDVYNHGDMERDFTYVDDIVEGVVRVMDRIPRPDPEWDAAAPAPDRSSAPYRLYNIGSNAPVRLMDFITEIERNLGLEAKKNLLPMQIGDIPKSHADVSELMADIGYAPRTTVAQGVKAFVDWYLEYYEVPRAGSRH